MAKVERLENVVELKDKQLIAIRAISVKQQEELKVLQQNTVSAPTDEEIITTFGEVGEKLGWHGWGPTANTLENLYKLGYLMPRPRGGYRNSTNKKAPLLKSFI